MKDPMSFTLSIRMARWHYKSHLWFRSVLTLDASAPFTNLKGGLPLHLQGSYPHKDTLYAVHCTRSFFIFYFFVIITWLGRFTFFPSPCHRHSFIPLLKVFLFSFFTPMLCDHSALRGRVQYLSSDTPPGLITSHGYDLWPVVSRTAYLRIDYGSILDTVSTPRNHK